jgi:hypothetical protein
MTTLREAAQQALKSLRGYRREISCEQPCDAERALEAAMEQPEQPVAWIHRKHYLLGHAENMPPADKALAQGWEPLYTHPPRREWRSLSEEEIESLWRKWVGTQRPNYSFTRAIEAALRSKNHE